MVLDHGWMPATRMRRVHGRLMPFMLLKMQKLYSKPLLRRFEKVRNDGFTSEEIEAAKSGWLQGQQVNRAQDGSLSRTLNSYLQLDRTMEWDADMEARLQALTPEQINAVMAKYLDPEQMVIVKAGDFAKSRETKP